MLRQCCCKAATLVVACWPCFDWQRCPDTSFVCKVQCASSPDALRAPSTAFSTSLAVRGKDNALPASRRAAQVVASASTSSAASSCQHAKQVRVRSGWVRSDRVGSGQVVDLYRQCLSLLKPENGSFERHRELHT